MVVIRRGGPWTAALLVLSLLVTLALSSPATATSGDVLNVVPAGTSIATSCSAGVVGGACGSTAGASTSFSDGNDSTAVATKCTVSGVDYQHCTFTAVFTGTAPTITAARVYIKVTGAHVFNIVLKRNGTTVHTFTADANTTSVAYDSGDVPVTVTGSGTFTLEMDADAAHLGGVNLGSWELGGATAVAASTYIINAHVEHPQFAWNIGWAWNIDWTGTMTVAFDSGGTFYAEGVSGALSTSATFTPVGGFTSYPLASNLTAFHQDCFPLCQSDHATITILDTGRNQSASYTFNRSDTGNVGTQITGPRIQTATACFNVTTDSCDPGGSSSAAGTVNIHYAFSGGPFGNVRAGPVDVVNGIGSIAVVEYSYLAQDCCILITADANPADTADGRLWMLEVTNGAGGDVVSFVLNFTTTDVQSYTKPNDTVTPGPLTACSLDHLDACIANVFAASSANLIAALTGPLADLKAQALTRQPFNYIIRAFDGVSAQLARATGEVTTSSTCDGYALTMPTPPPVRYNTPSATVTVQSWPSGVPLPSFAVLRCADLEPWGGTTWWQAIRGAMDPAIYLAWGFAQLRRLRPTMVMGA